MSTSLTSKSATHAAALDITLAILAKTEFKAAGGTSSADFYGKKAAEFANAIFNSALENLQKK